MNRSNLPPGVRASDLPGNGPDDEAFDKFSGQYEATELHTDAEIDAAFARWQAGLDPDDDGDDDDFDDSDEDAEVMDLEDRLEQAYRKSDDEGEFPW